MPVSSIILPDGRKLGDLRVSDLKKELEMRGLSRTGVKKELHSRLIEALEFKSKIGDSSLALTDVDELEVSTNDDSGILEVGVAASDEVVDSEVNIQGEISKDVLVLAGCIMYIFSNLFVETSDTMHIHFTNRISDDITMNESETELTDIIPSSIDTQETVDNNESKSEIETRPNVLDENQPIPSVNECSKQTVIDVQPSNRRRQWGFRNTNSTPLSSESLEKLLSNPVSRPVILSVSPTTDNQSNLPELVHNDGDDEQQSKKEKKHEEVLDTTTTTTTNIPNEEQSLPSDNIVDGNMELDVDTVVGHIDSDETIDADTSTFDSRTVHLVSDFDRKENSASSNTILSTELQSENDPCLKVQLNSIGFQNSNTRTTIPTDNIKRSSPVKRKGPRGGETKAVGYMVDPPERVEPCQTAKHSPTDIIYIKYLVRPFTAQQLRQMVSTNYGNVIDLWLNKIKSTSLIQMESIGEATKCRENLDGSRWPSMNPHMLRCEFASRDLFDWMKVNGDSSDLHPPKHLLNNVNDDENPILSASSKKSDEKSISNGGGEGDLRNKIGRSGREIEHVQKLAPIHPTLLEAKPKNEEPAKLLNNLFRKTVATPSIYWLPANNEQDNQETGVVAVKPDAVDKPKVEVLHPKSRSPFATRPQPNQDDKVVPIRDPTARTSLTTTSDSKPKPVQTTPTPKPNSDSLSKTTSSSSSSLKKVNTSSENRRSSDLRPKKNDSRPRHDSGTGKNHESDTNQNLKRSIKPPDGDNRNREHSSPSATSLDTSTQHRQSSDCKTTNNERSSIPSKQPRISPSPKRSKSPSSKKKTFDSYNRSDCRRRSSSSRSNSPVRRNSYKRGSFNRYNDNRRTTRYDQGSSNMRSGQRDRRSRSRSNHRHDRTFSGRYRSSRR